MPRPRARRRKRIKSPHLVKWLAIAVLVAFMACSFERFDCNIGFHWRRGEGLTFPRIIYAFSIITNPANWF